MKESIIIYYIYSSPEEELDIFDKGWRSDIYVYKNDEYFLMNVYEISVIDIAFKNEIKENGYFSMEPNLIIVDELTFENIRKTIISLNNDGYFNYLKPLPPEKISNGEVEITFKNEKHKLIPLP